MALRFNTTEGPPRRELAISNLNTLEGVEQTKLFFRTQLDTTTACLWNYTDHGWFTARIFHAVKISGFDSIYKIIGEVLLGDSWYPLRGEYASLDRSGILEIFEFQSEFDKAETTLNAEKVRCLLEITFRMERCHYNGKFEHRMYDSDNELNFYKALEYIKRIGRAETMKDLKQIIKEMEE